MASVLDPITKQCINRKWMYSSIDLQDAQLPDFDDSNWVQVNIPHTNKLFPHHNFGSCEYQFISWYRKTIEVPIQLNNQNVFLDFDGVMIACDVFANGTKICTHKGGFTPFTLDITEYFDDAGKCLIAVRVDSTERKDIPPYGNVVDYLTFGGIYRDVFLRICNLCHLENVFVGSSGVLCLPKLNVKADLLNSASAGSIKITLIDCSGKDITQSHTSVTGGVIDISFDIPKGVQLWDLKNPYLYNVDIEVLDENEFTLDSCRYKHGFREAEFCADGAFRLNGSPIKLFGLNRHQSYPYIGIAAPARLQRRDADILKHELGLNIVRTSHYPQSPHFLDRCDEIGLLVFEEIPGWQFVGDEKWKEVSKQELRDMIIRDRNHPSIILWGVRINESGDDKEFYTQTNKIAHELDPTRPTGGVRCFSDSEFIEDVFTINDFSNTVIEPNHIPYLITEFGGHMFPTKAWDCEERKLEQALRHAKIQSIQMQNEKIAGAIGWCAFDYNTHSGFGSGDGICYHGVCDIFRLPKWTAALYASQADPADKIVLEPASNWTMGDRSGGRVEPLVIFCNCDSLTIFNDDSFVGEYLPDIKNYPGLIHPPFVISNLTKCWGNSIPNIRIDGYVDNKKVAQKSLNENHIPHKLKLWVDSGELIADGQDMTALNFQVVDKCENVLPYTSNIVYISISGPAEIIGTNPFIPQGGQGAVYIKSTFEPGIVDIKATVKELGEYEAQIKIVSENS